MRNIVTSLIRIGYILTKPWGIFKNVIATTRTTFITLGNHFLVALSHSVPDFRHTLMYTYWFSHTAHKYSFIG